MIELHFMIKGNTVEIRGGGADVTNYELDSYERIIRAIKTAGIGSLTQMSEFRKDHPSKPPGQ